MNEIYTTHDIYGVDYDGDQQQDTGKDCVICLATPPGSHTHTPLFPQRLQQQRPYNDVINSYYLQIQWFYLVAICVFVVIVVMFSVIRSFSFFLFFPLFLFSPPSQCEKCPICRAPILSLVQIVPSGEELKK